MTTAYILVVDDEPDIRRLVQEILQDEGYEVSVAENGATAREARRARRPDLTLLDIWMPDIDGISLLKEWGEGANRMIGRQAYQPGNPFKIKTVHGARVISHVFCKQHETHGRK